ncbi:MAG: ribonuclease III [Candidatus Methylomirabilales bacterium]
MRRHQKDKDTDAWVQEVERRLGHRFRRRTLLRAALTHPSVGAEGKTFRRLAFLGDAVLTLLLGLHVYQDHPDLPPGGLTRLRASMVNRTTLARAAAQLGLPMLLRLGKGDDPAGQERSSVLAAAFEAVVAALYLDRGLGAVSTFLDHHLLPLYIPDDSLDPKSELQTRWQGVFKMVPRYRVLRQLGPPHAPRFEVEVRAGGRRLAKGMGRSRQEAERMAAQAALTSLLKDHNILGPSSG